MTLAQYLNSNKYYHGSRGHTSCAPFYLYIYINTYTSKMYNTYSWHAKKVLQTRLSHAIVVKNDKEVPIKMENTEKARKSLTMTKELADWLKKESDRKGINVNALINVILNEYKERNGG